MPFDAIEVVPRCREQHLLIWSRSEHVLEDGQAQVVALLFLKIRSVAVVEAIEHFENVEIDNELGPARPIVEAEHQGIRHVLHESRPTSYIPHGELELAPLIETVRADTAAFDLANLERQVSAEEQRIQEALA